jgi:hypothetical protein
MAISKASLRGLRFNERVAKMQEATKDQRPTVRVTPKNDTLRKLLKHPKAGGFRKEAPADWPDDSFTKRRIRDGDITVEGNTPPPHRSHRKQTDESAA